MAEWLQHVSRPVAALGFWVQSGTAQVELLELSPGGRVGCEKQAPLLPFLPPAAPGGLSEPSWSEREGSGPMALCPGAVCGYGGLEPCPPVLLPGRLRLCMAAAHGHRI